MENGLSPADISALTGNGINGGFGEMIWLFAIIALMGGGFGNGWGNGNGNTIGAVTSGTAQTIAASTANAQNAINAIKDGNAGIIREFGTVESALTALGGKQQECCCNTLRAIDQTRYEAALNTASINETSTANAQKILDAIAGNRMADMQNQINALQLQNATAGMLKFPQAWTYGAGPFPPIFGCPGQANI